MYRRSFAALLFVLVACLIFARPVCGYSRITNVELFAPLEVEVEKEITVEAVVYTGNNVVEYVHDVSVVLLLPDSVKLVSGDNPVFIGEMGPGPAKTICHWQVLFEQAGEYILTVNASCIDTQSVPQSMNASSTVWVYAPPHVEFEYAPMDNVRVNVSVIFNATKSFALGPNSTLVLYTWDFGDETNMTTSEPVIEHKFTRIGNFTISLNVTDNKGLSGLGTKQISISLFGDVNYDGRVNIIDISIVAIAFKSRLGEEGWNEVCDIDQNGIVDIVDIAVVAREYGKTI